jgi:hypothetical protein
MSQEFDRANDHKLSDDEWNQSDGSDDDSDDNDKSQDGIIPIKYFQES